jgi:RimJ/RimL family protein N-acetyltransferase
LDPARHAETLFRANGSDETGRMWTYLPYGPFASAAAYRDWLDQVAGLQDPLFFAVADVARNSALGVLALQRIDVTAGSAEVAHVTFSPALQGTTAATEAVFLVISLVFDAIGYRRLEWKCDALNARSRRAASRFGFVYEGTFRQAAVVKGRNRDTTWFSIIDSEWPRLKGAYQAWLSPDNFDEDGRQRISLSQLTAENRT